MCFCLARVIVIGTRDYLNRAKLEYLSSIVFHTVLRTHSLATRTVWNTIDD